MVMDTKNRLNPQPQTLSPSKSGRRRTTTDDCTSSPEFEFWMVRNPSFPQPNILSADELFVDGVLLPLHLLSTQNKPDPTHKTQHPDQETPTPEPPAPDPDPGPEPSPAITDSSAAAASSTLSASKRWKDIFRKGDKKNAENNTNTEENEKDKEKAKKKERKGGSGSAASAAELNINIWPFSRSRSAGNAATRPKLFPGAPVTRKANSAPCSRSNSAGESKSRKWPSSPGRAGVHLGRSSPVWQVRRGGSASKNPEQPLLNPDKWWSRRETSTVGRRCKVPSSSSSGGGGKARVLNLNVPTCIDYSTHLSCRSDVNSAIGSDSNIRGSNGNGNGGDGSNVGGKLFNLRSLFKKSLLTSH